LNYGTAYFELDSEPAIFETAVRALAEGVSLRSTARIIQIDKDTACAWLHRAAHHSRLVLLSLWRQLPITECQLDELWSFVHTKEQNLYAAKLFCETYGDAWVWVAFAPIWRLVLAYYHLVLPHERRVCASGCRSQSRHGGVAHRAAGS
jgi:hypothetical protein